MKLNRCIEGLCAGYPRPRPARTDTSQDRTDRRPKHRPRSVSVGPNSGRSGRAARKLARPEPTLAEAHEILEALKASKKKKSTKSTTKETKKPNTKAETGD